MQKVSVIIPIYNVEQYLVECLDSVINQTEKDIEIICVEDCSTDSSLEILKEYAKKDDRIIILQNEVNSGLSVTRNNGLAIAKGEYVLFVDSDDFLKPTLLETTLKYAENVDMVCFNYEEYNLQKISGFSHDYLVENGLYSNEDYFIEVAKKNSFIVVAWSKLYRREFLVNNNLQFEPGMLYEDNLFYLQSVLKAKIIYSINEPLYIYRIRPGSIMTKKIGPKNVNDQYKLLCETINEYVKNNSSKKFDLAIEKFINMLGRAYVRCLRTYLIADKGDSKFSEFDHQKQQKIYMKLMLGIGCYVNFSDEQLERVINNKNVIVYGAGDIAREVISCFDLNDISIVGVAVSNIQNNRKSLMGNPVRELRDYEQIKADCIVVIAVASKFVEEIKKNLEKNGFNNYIELF